MVEQGNYEAIQDMTKLVLGVYIGFSLLLLSLVVLDSSLRRVVLQMQQCPPQRVQRWQEEEEGQGTRMLWVLLMAAVWMGSLAVLMMRVLV